MKVDLFVRNSSLCYQQHQRELEIIKHMDNNIKCVTSGHTLKIDTVAGALYYAKVCDPGSQTGC